MGFELGGAGAGAAFGLEELLTRQRAEQMLREQMAFRQMQQQQLHEDRQARLSQSKLQAEAMGSARKDASQARQSAINMQQLQALSPGTTLGPETFARMTSPETGAALPEQFDASQGTSASLPSISLSGLAPLSAGDPGVSSMTPETSQAIAPSFRFKGTAQQQEKDAAQRSAQTRLDSVLAGQEQGRRETERHDRAMETRDRPNRTVIQQGLDENNNPILLSVDLETGVATPVQMPKGAKPNRPAKPVSGAERQTLAFYNRMKDSLANIEPAGPNGTSLEDQIASQGLAGQLQGQYMPNVGQSTNQQLYRQAQRAYTEARLRKESGAAIPESEFQNDARTYFVQPGDSLEVVKQKRAARQTVLQGLKNASGRAYEEFYGTSDKPKSDAETGLPTVGGTFQGSKVLKVEKIQ